ncbi:MAG: hypothetical protein A2268_16005 [Candidatus Raymondbacteria bacterium RifOxyA12_full_50_37]|uniref:Prenyltransferase n=1 Tax=Candidatus Raymondbacteria bacterium RIFOXYD12_FULL_49_13 TaxID=1817890 RepID=A0A1F7F5S1_UNCRA|nr:MAG: hypothetical protein A2268_16005 [Candidatus Raymondbacteria bacterium RifOxyA12_full_50_37]OGJ89252.1 MAG: hypothetical protein A2248_18900 [Candidatus Raymondbacteria bacterium RIFOXYA2_FULL_49_16]OGJ97418.1 MAG: hypothetical protein A2453_03820 [Candidatus Raymondbacteria bacterium RIFOXYC2_FULL_50_21]OGK01932.1 MAG: hypothetical protein A2519_05705 [Candidatus Raymondbacteria bacterium RIFOXYD12_FULL_49_13]OGK03802.1 MAG: hypothetical protein A2350_11445 [Candidatus Raymondbacteria 
MKKAFLFLCDALFITRPIIFIPVWGYFILGVYRAKVLFAPEALYHITILGRDFPIMLSFGSAETITGLIMFTLLLGGAYVLNQLTDIEADKENEGLPLIAKAGVSTRLAAIETGILLLVPSLYSVYVGGHTCTLFLCSLLLLVAYSAKPFRFTGRPFLDFLSNALGYGLLAFGLGWLYALGNEFMGVRTYLKEAAPYFFFMVAGSINSTIPDMEGDEKAGKTTTAVFMGTRLSNGISTGAIICALAFAFQNHDPIAIVTGLVCIPFFFRYLLTNNPKHVMMTFQFCGGFLMALEVLIFPWFFFFGIMTFALTRLYFLKRYNITYPKLG